MTREPLVFDEQRAENDLRSARGERVLRVLDRAQAAAGLHRHVDGFADALDRGEILTRAERAVEIDHVQPPRTRVDERLRAFDRIVVVRDLGRRIALLHADAFAAAQVDRGDDEHLVLAARRSSSAARSARTARSRDLRTSPAGE